MFGTLFNQKNDNEEKKPVPSGQDASVATGSTPVQDQTTPIGLANNQDQTSAQSTESVGVPQSQEGQQQAPSGTPTQPGAVQKDDDTTGANPVQNQGMSALSHLDPRAAQVLTHAQEETKRIKQQFIEPDQLLFGLLYDDQIYKIAAKFKVDSGVISKEIQAREKMGAYHGQPTLSQISQQIFEQSYRDAKMRGSNFVSPEDILVTLCAPTTDTGKYLESRGFKKEAVVDTLSKDTNLNYSKKTVLEKYGTDLTEEARAGRLDPIAGRDQEIDRMVHILLRRTKNNPIIIGETGVGKTAIVEGLAQAIAKGDVPQELKDKRVFQLDVASLVAGASHRGEFEERLRSVINEVLSSNNQIVLFVDEVHSLLGTGEGEGVSAANIIKPHLARGHFQMIGATTTIEYRKNFEKDKAFERRFQPVTAEEPSEENAFLMLKVLRPKYEKFHKVTIPDETLKECVKLSKKYIGERYLPDKAVDLLDEGASDVKLMADEGRRKDTTLRKEDVEKVVSNWTGIPITKLTEDESEKLLKLEDRIHHRLIDQMEAVVAVSEAVRRGRIGLASANRPIASFVFLGPTGVGKTELAKTLAELLFGRDDAMARLDMSEYMEKHEVAKLIGAPPGYVGYEEGGQLTEAVRKKPYSIVLLDEIEKAHPDVFNILLQLLEDGRLTDNKGNTISFKNTIVICTSNIGSSMIQQELSKTDKNVKHTPEQNAESFKHLQGLVKEELIKFFRPELLNRFDDVVIFKPLLQEHMAGIARLGIKKTAGLLKEQGFVLQCTEKAIAQLAKDGYDPVYGARPLRRLIQTAVENPVAIAIISKKFAVGDTIVVDYDSGKNEFVFKKGASASENINPKKILLEIVNPGDIKDKAKKDQFTKLHDDLVVKSKGGDSLASSIMSITPDTSDETIKEILDNLEKAKQGGDMLFTDVLTAVNAEMAEEAEEAHEAEPVTKFKKLLQQVINPLYLSAPGNKERFSALYDKLSVANQEGNKLAGSILAITDITSDEDIAVIKKQLEEAKAQNDPFATEVLAVLEAGTKTDEVAKLRETVGFIVNPITAESSAKKTQYDEIRVKLAALSEKGNAVASAVMGVSDATTDDQLILIKTQIENGRNSNDEAALLLSNVLSMSPAVQDAQVQMAKQNTGAQPKDPNQAYPFGPGQQSPQPIQPSVAGAAQTMPEGGASARVQTDGQSVGGPTFQSPVQDGGAVAQGAGMAALNEQLERDNQIINNQLESEGESIA